MGKRFMAVAVVGLLLVSSPAWGHSAITNDGDDVRGQLDLRRVRVDHDGDSITIVWRTWERFTAKPWRHGGFIETEIRGLEFRLLAYVSLTRRNHRWMAHVSYRGTRDDTYVPVRRPSPEVAKAVIPMSLLHPHPDEGIRWHTYSKLCQELGCWYEDQHQDHLPDNERRLVLHEFDDN